MKFNYFNFFVIFLFVFILLSSTTLSCTNFSPHYADSIFKKEGKFEGFQDKSKILGYTKKDDHSALNNYNMHLIKEEPDTCGKAVEKCKNVFGFNGLFCDPLAADEKIDIIGNTKANSECVNNSLGLSKSTGGLCLSDNQVNLLTTRGGNMSTGEEIIGSA